jgi:membrane protein DedA with SNARE-associated domain
VQDWVIEVVREMGVVGVGLLMFAENIFPPLPSEVIMPLAGYLSLRREMAFWPAVLAGTLGSLAGAVVWYWIGRRITYEQFGRWVEEHGAWMAMTREDVDRAVGWFQGHGRYSILLGRLVPLVRTLISVPAGFSRMPLPRFLVLSAAGTLIWTGALAYVGYFLGQRFHEVERYIGPLSWVVIAAAVVAYVYRVLRIRSAQRG